MCRAFIAVNEFLLDLVSEVSELVHQITRLELKSYQVLILGLTLQRSGVLVAEYPPANSQNC